MAFFGITAQGDYNNLLSIQNIAVPDAHALELLDDAVYETAFRAHVLGDGQLAKDLQVDGAQTIERKSLITILRQLLGRNPRQSEFDRFFTWFDFDSSCTMSHTEYRKAYCSLKASQCKHSEPREWHSYAQKHQDWLRHKRVAYEPQDALQRDLLESQRIGMHQDIETVVRTALAMFIRAHDELQRI